ncbi:cobalt ECF transporter T component CbiQ [Chloroflexus sp.]|uniref:cobalt ECF transporter T component CbiQ n=1 Tax=Chloroflexus sp. TaxID=1904827 RepID=UPI0026314527|nr:cobalt ECF transporter T component CbiQ [uncultured Chloroflexus sp.]
MLRVIDRYAFANRLRAVDPAQKGGIALGVILLCVALDRPIVGLMALLWMVGMTVGYGRIPMRIVVTVLGAESVFLALSVIGLVVSIGFEYPDQAQLALSLGPIWVSVSNESLQTALHVLSRTLGAASALNFLILTTPLVDLIELLRRLRMPALVIELMMLTYRAIFILLETLEQMTVAQTARLGYASWRATMRSSALLGSQLFIAAFRRSQALELALTARGFSGDLRVLPLTYVADRRLWWIAGLIVMSLTLAGWLV